ncbi:MAG: TolB family protein [Planctomycetota bacterium]|jgi:Tol biopolymer transport system component
MIASCNDTTPVVDYIYLRYFIEPEPTYSLGGEECAPEPPSGWIAFASNADGDWDIWAVRPDGTGLRQLTDMPGEEVCPYWSPDSTKIVYPTNNTPYGTLAQLRVYDWFTGANTKIYDAHDYQGQNFGSYMVSHPAWSPDAGKILFREDASYNNPHITVINADGTGRAIVPVQSGYVSAPSWSPSGTAFVYDRRNSGASYTHDLWIYDFTATGDIMNGINHRLTAGACSESTTKFEPDWMPSGNVVFAWGHNLVIIDPGQSPNWRDPPISDLSDPHVTRLTDDAIYPSLRYADPSWSPDLSHITYARSSVDGPYDLWVMDASGSNLYQLTATSYGEQNPEWGNPPPEPPCHVVYPNRLAM